VQYFLSIDTLYKDLEVDRIWGYSSIQSVLARRKKIAPLDGIPFSSTCEIVRAM